MAALGVVAHSIILETWTPTSRGAYASVPGDYLPIIRT